MCTVLKYDAVMRAVLFRVVINVDPKIIINVCRHVFI